MRSGVRTSLGIVWGAVFAATSVSVYGGAAADRDLFALCTENRAIHRFSAYVTCDGLENMLSYRNGVRDSIDWCRRTGVTKVYLETFRDAWARKGDLLKVRRAFREAGIETGGGMAHCWIPPDGRRCYHDRSKQKIVMRISEFTASLFDDIIVDDFWFYDCDDARSQALFAARTVVVNGKEYPVPGDSVSDYRCTLMYHLARENIVGAAKRVNPGARVFIKFPQWYDEWYRMGYDVFRQTAVFDGIWVGTEIREFDSDSFGGRVPPTAYYMSMWLGRGIGGEKYGGAWYDELETSPATYVEQARMTVLGGARETVLWYLDPVVQVKQHGGATPQVLALRRNIPELLSVAREVQRRTPVGIAIYNPGNTECGDDYHVFDFVGLFGMPFTYHHRFPADAPAGFFSYHCLKDPDIVSRLREFIEAGKPTMLTRALAEALRGKIDVERENVCIVSYPREPFKVLEHLTAHHLMTLGREELDRIKQIMMKPFGISLSTPNKVGFYLYSDGSWVIANFDEQPALITFNGETLTVPARGWKYEWK